MKYNEVNCTLSYPSLFLITYIPLMSSVYIFFFFGTSHYFCNQSLFSWIYNFDISLPSTIQIRCTFTPNVPQYLRIQIITSDFMALTQPSQPLKNTYVVTPNAGTYLLLHLKSNHWLQKFVLEFIWYELP